MGLGWVWWLLLEDRKLGKSADEPGHWPHTSPLRWGGSSCFWVQPLLVGPSSGPGLMCPRHVESGRSVPHTENKLEKNEEAVLLSWEMYLKESYLQSQQDQQRQRPERKMEDISHRCGGQECSTRGCDTPTDRAHLGDAQRLLTWGWEPPCGSPCTSTGTGPSIS